MANYMSYGGRAERVPAGGSTHGQSSMSLNDYEQYLRDLQAGQGRQGRGGVSGDAGRIMSAMYGGQPRMGDAMDGFSTDNIPGVNMGLRGPDGTGLAGMEAGPQKQGPGTRGYYRFGAIPTAWNNEVIKPEFYNYSDTPDLAAMIRNPWDPTQWDPNQDFTPGGRTQSEAYSNSMGGQRRGRGSERRSRLRGR